MVEKIIHFWKDNNQKDANYGNLQLSENNKCPVFEEMQIKRQNA